LFAHEKLVHFFVLTQRNEPKKSQGCKIFWGSYFYACSRNTTRRPPTGGLLKQYCLQRPTAASVKVFTFSQNILRPYSLYIPDGRLSYKKRDSDKLRENDFVQIYIFFTYYKPIVDLNIATLPTKGRDQTVMLTQSPRSKQEIIRLPCKLAPSLKLPTGQFLNAWPWKFSEAD
jgi:hypothetical protein